MPKLVNTSMPVAARFCTLTESEETRLQCIFEQVEGCADLLHKYLEVENDNPAMTGLNILREKASEGKAIIREAFRRTVTGK